MITANIDEITTVYTVFPNGLVIKVPVSFDTWSLNATPMKFTKVDAIWSIGGHDSGNKVPIFLTQNRRKANVLMNEVQTVSRRETPPPLRGNFG